MSVPEKLASFNRRRFLQTTAGGIAALTGSATLLRPHEAFAAGETVRWVSQRGTIEVLDDYPYWVAKKFGYFGDIATTLEPGPLEATATIKLVDQKQADVGYPSPGVFSLGLAQGIKLTSAFEMGALDVFSMAFQKGKAPSSLKALEGKTVVLGSAGWQAITDPMLAQVGVDVKKIKYVEAGNGWAQALAQGKADSALSWEGLRAQWKGQGLDFDYILGRDFSAFPANSFIIRTSDFEDASKRDLYVRYFRGWAMGLEYGYQNPRSATQIVMEQFPGLASQMTPDIATESMMQLANVFRGNFEKRQGWGWHDLEGWSKFLATLKQIGQLTSEIDAKSVIKNDWVADINKFDVAKVKADSASFKLSPDYEKVNVAEIAKRI
jgi:NitT/TauT family transport system substrate-binding protein